jgi:hypothetical protein
MMWWLRPQTTYAKFCRTKMNHIDAQVAKCCNLERDTSCIEPWLAPKKLF